MQNMLKTLEKCLVCMLVMAGTSAVFADTPARNSAMTGRSGRDNVNTARMPVMPILPVNAVGNMSVEPGNVTPSNPTPDNPTPDDPTPDTPVTPVEPDCPDGGVANSEYTVETCMNDVLACVNGGALPNGINSLFNEDLRNSIVNGMGLCLTQVEHCVTTVRKNCQNVYASSSDVWLDFNARKVQPEYYSFVLRQTGLTPTQAENTCLLLDRNTYGLSFDAVSSTDNVTSEYAKNVGAYNSQMNNTLSKANPLGAKINDTGIDGKRGYYARWDAENAQCLLRVAAYNKDDHITNSWLFGIAGDETPAEIWKEAGSTFTCNKDLFGFSLMPKTKTTAAVAIPGGTLLGAGIGAMAGHGDRDFDCKDEDMRKQLFKKLQGASVIGPLNLFLDTDLSNAANTMSLAQCNEVVYLYDQWQKGQEAVKFCDSKFAGLSIEIERKVKEKTEICDGDQVDQCAEEVYNGVCMLEGKLISKCNGVSLDDIKLWLTTLPKDHKCTFHRLNTEFRDAEGLYCSGGEDCVSVDEFQKELDSLKKIFGSIDLLDGQKSNRLKTTLIGAGTGAAVGGTATAITAFVERNNINCRVADGLARVGFGKSYTIDRLRDFYVKWALNLPNTIAPTAVVTNCDNWQLTCALFTDANECTNAQFNYRPGNLSSTTLVRNPCKPSGSACIANLSVAQSNGACLVTPETPDTPSGTDYSNVASCMEWNNVCQTYNKNAAGCVTAKVIYAPASMLISNACKYQSRINECRPSLTKVTKYMDAADCPFRLE